MVYTGRGLEPSYLPGVGVERGDELARGVQGIGHYVRPSRTYNVLAGVTRSLPLAVVTVPGGTAGPTLAYGGALPGNGGIRWGETYRYVLTVLLPDGTETPAGAVQTITTPALPGAPIVTIEQGAGAVWTDVRAYAFVRRYIDPTGTPERTPVGPVVFGHPGGIPSGLSGRNYRIAVGADAGQLAADARTGDQSWYELWRGPAPGAGSSTIFWSLDGQIGIMAAGDSVLDTGLVATAGSPPAGWPRIAVGPVAPPPSPDAAFRVYGRSAANFGLLTTLGAGSSASWTDDGSIVPRAAVQPPLIPEAASEPVARAYHPDDTLPFGLDSRLVTIELGDGPAYVQFGMGAGGGSWEDELRVPGPGRTEYRVETDRLRIRTADASGVLQTRYRVEVYD